MSICTKCAADLIPGAKFCHHCGDTVTEKVKNCPVCREQSPSASVFCHHCGFHFEGKQAKQSRKYEPVYTFDFNPETMTDQVKTLFFKNLRNRVEEEHDIDRYSDYVERFYQSKFRSIYELRSEQIAEEVMLQWERFGSEAYRDIDKRIESSFEGLLDYFIIQFCPDLNGVMLPPGILKYERVSPGKTDVRQMITDFLDFDHEEEVIYFDFISMQEDLLANACKSFLFADRKEKVMFICDLSLKGSCKEGFSMTDQAIYWRAPFDKARRVAYREITEIRKKKDWLTINGSFFTANPSLNLKLCKLLKKLRACNQLEASRGGTAAAYEIS